jgi:Ni/Fe-hydrogenase subunit HybB-like protein
MLGQYEGAVTNLDNHIPWGIWIAFDVACGVALAAGGFTTAALVEIFGRKRYLALLRPALLTAFLGYLWVAIALSFDLGRYWNIWRPIFNWQGNSVSSRQAGASFTSSC